MLASRELVPPTSPSSDVAPEPRLEPKLEPLLHMVSASASTRSDTVHGAAGPASLHESQHDDDVWTGADLTED